MKHNRAAAVVLLAVGAAMFATGTAIERTGHHDEAAATTAPGPVSAHDEAAESPEHHDLEGTAANTEHDEHDEHDEGTILGINRESTAMVVFAVLASLAAAALLWFRPRRAVWALVGLVALAFALFDSAEVVHQLDASKAGLAVLAAAVFLAHGCVALLAATSARPATTA